MEDVIDPEYGLQQDDWSLTNPRFGDDGQLEVIGWSGRNGRNKLYILKCHTCKMDKELHGCGLFRCIKGGLARGQLPCGCSSAPKWSEQQYATICKRKSEYLGYTFLGWAEMFNAGRHTKTRILCDVHGAWVTGTIHGLLSAGSGCPGCRVESVRAANFKPDSVMIDSFFTSGQFPSGTRFWRGERLNSQGQYWHVYCPECNYQGESKSSNLQRGQRPCLCSPSRQQEAYINWIVGDNNNAIALKFGIANNSKQRMKAQNRESSYEVRQYLVYTFPTKKQCLAAERECKQSLICGIIPRHDMPDGHTETTSVLNLGRVKDIYEKNGGIRQ